jgi:hypothetical protein
MAVNSTGLISLHGSIEWVITNILINNSIVISAFTSESSTAGSYEIVFTVTPAHTSQISNIKLRDTSNSVFYEYQVNIPLLGSDAIIRISIAITQGGV